MITIKDITDLKRIQTELKDSEALLKLAVTNAEMGTWHIDLKTQIVTASKAAAAIFGYESISGNIFDEVEKMFHPEDKAEANAVWTNAAVSNIPYEHEFRIIRPNGDVRWLSSKGRTELSSVGEPITFTGIIADITKRKVAELKLAESEHRLRSILENSQIGTWKITFPDGLITGDALFREFHNVPQTEDINHAIDRLSHPDDSMKIKHELAMTIATGAPYACEYRIKNRDGSFRWTEAKGEAIYNSDGKLVSIEGVAFDIEKRKRAELELESAKANAEKSSVEATRANETKSAFLANMSHEIRTPLGAILGYTDLLKERSISSEDRANYLEVISRNGDALSHLIDDILDLAKVEAGKLTIELAPINVIALVEDVARLFKDKAKNQGIDLTVCNSPLLPEVLFTDRTRLRQILINIVGNAIKFTKTGFVKIDVNGGIIDSKFWKLQIKVIDTGKGISAEQAKILFAPFSQADVSTTREYGGTGLGLVLSRRLARALGGDVYIDSKHLGAGATFVISFVAEQVAPTQNSEIQTEHNPKADSKPDSRSRSTINTTDPGAIKLDGVNLLLVEDSPDNQFLLKKILSNTGARMEIASNGLEGFERATSANYDLVLMDIQMPVMDGFQAIRALRKVNYAVPVIALTAHAMSEEREKTRQAGFAAHVTKPIRKLELIETIRRVLDTRVVKEPTDEHRSVDLLQKDHHDCF